jgi:hypothetical protein
VPGFLLNPIVGLAALLCTVGTAVLGRSRRALRGARGLPLYAAALLAIAGAVVTRGILVPLMRQIQDPHVSAGELERICAAGAAWWAVNDAIHVLAFACSVWALLAICSGAPSPRPLESDVLERTPS